MEVRLDINGVRTPAPPVAKPAGKASKTVEEKISFNDAATLEKALQETPEVRTDVVDNAKRLIGDPTYPPRETLQKIANLLAIGMGT